MRMRADRFCNALRGDNAAEEEEMKRRCYYVRGLDDIAASEDKLARATEALERIDQWAKAYPLDVFPEPDWKKARKLLEDGGMTLDAISASNMRHVVKGVGAIVTDALKEIMETQTPPPGGTDGGAG
jgi:hypothetical protein